MKYLIFDEKQQGCLRESLMKTIMILQILINIKVHVSYQLLGVFGTIQIN